MLCALLAGCAGPGERFRPEQIAPGEALIYVYRPRAPISPGPLGVVIDQEQAASLGPNQYVATPVAPGEHLVRVQRRSSATRRVTLGPGESVYLEARSTLLGGRVSLDRPGEQIARERIAGARRVTPRGPQPPPE